MGTNTRVEDITVIGSTSDENKSIIGVEFPGLTNTNAKLRTAVVNVTHLGTGPTGTIYGICCTGNSGPTGPQYIYSVRASSASVTSSTAGPNSALVSIGSNRFTVRDCIFFSNYGTGDTGGLTGSFGVYSENINTFLDIKTSTIGGDTFDIGGVQVGGTGIGNLQFLATDLIHSTTNTSFQIANTSNIISYTYGGNNSKPSSGGTTIVPGYTTHSQSINSVDTGLILSNNSIITKITVRQAFVSSGYVNVHIHKNTRTSSPLGIYKIDNIIPLETTIYDTLLLFNTNDILIVELVAVGSIVSNDYSVVLTIY